MWVCLLLVACAAAAVSCVRLCRVAAAAADIRPAAGERGAPPRELRLYETAFLAGGPHRVTDVTLVAMCRQRRMLLADTGWATVVDPDGRDEVERSLISCMGPPGQARIPAIRDGHAAADALRELGERLASAGLAVPAAVRESLRDAIRQTGAAAVLSVALLLVTAGLGVPGGDGPGLLWWFALPLVLTAGCLLIARAEIHPYTRWASPAGQALLRAQGVPRPRHGSLGAAVDGPAEDDRRLLVLLAVRGAAALSDPALSAALGTGRRGHP